MSFGNTLMSGGLLLCVVGILALGRRPSDLEFMRAEWTSVQGVR